MTETPGRWNDSLAAAATRAYEATHGSAIHESRHGLRLAMSWRQAVAGAVAVVLVALGGWWFTRPDAVQTVPLAAPTASPAAGSGPGGTGASGVVDGSVVVDVSGAVEAPGLVTLPPGARVADAIDAAGGASADAVLDELNLARKVTDGEQVLVPREGEQEESTGGGLVNLNQADASELDDLPGIGPVLADRIVADRDANGPFASIDDLARVPGVGDAIVGALAAIATV